MTLAFVTRGTRGQADARPQVTKNRRRIRWNTLRIFRGREQSRCLIIVRHSRRPMSDRLQGKSLYGGGRRIFKGGDGAGDQVLSCARRARTQEPIGSIEYGRCSLDARRLEST